jgi:hypothetical protein
VRNKVVVAFARGAAWRPSVAQHRRPDIHDLLAAWRRFAASAPPFVLEADEVLVQPSVAKRWTAMHAGWREFTANPGFGASDRRLHLALLPMPFAGPLETASVVVLMLNPGLSPVDYFAEYEVPEFRNTLLSNLQRSAACPEHLNPFLNPQFAWHSGFGYWHGKFRELIANHAAAHGRSLAESLRVFSREIAFLELYPYHSESFGLPRSIRSRLVSARLACSYAHEVLLPRALSGETLLLVTRQAKEWDIGASRNVIVYSSGEARGAHLTPRSRGGEAILRHIPAR